MAESKVAAELVMNGGDGVHSYSKNSNAQRNGIEAGKELIMKGIDEMLDIDIFASSKTFRVADLGCATGPNTFLAMNNIIEAVKLKFHSRGKTCFELPEFQVFFNDNVSNDFNQLFATLPLERQYFAMGVPGSFHSRLFPASSLHMINSSFAFHILSRVPKKVEDKSSIAWNRGRIMYANSREEVVKAYEEQYVEDLENFLKAREEEVVRGGLMVFLMLCRPNGTAHNEAFVNKAFEALESCLFEMANEGKVSREQIDSFNFPLYFASPKEFEEVIKRNKCFNIEIMESLPQAKQEAKEVSTSMRVGLEGILKTHFGVDILDDLFDMLLRKIQESFICNSQDGIVHFTLLRRITT